MPGDYDTGDDLRRFNQDVIAKAWPSPVSDNILTVLAHYRQVFLDIMRVAGADVSDIDHPDQIVHPDISEVALAEVKELRDAYDETLDELDVALNGYGIAPYGVADPDEDCRDCELDA